MSKSRTIFNYQNSLSTNQFRFIDKYGGCCFNYLCIRIDTSDIIANKIYILRFSGTNFIYDSNVSNS